VAFVADAVILNLRFLQVKDLNEKHTL